MAFCDAALNLAEIPQRRRLLWTHVVVAAVPWGLIYHRNPLMVVVYLAREISRGHHLVIGMRNHQEDVGLKTRVQRPVIVTIPIRLGVVRGLGPENSSAQRTEQTCDNRNSYSPVEISSSHRFILALYLIVRRVVKAQGFV